MTSDLAGTVKGSSGFLNGFDPCKDPGLSVLAMQMASRVVLAPRKRKRADKVYQNNQMGWALAMRMIKRYKGIRWMPWHAQAMKDVIRCDKPRGAANKL